MDGTTFSAWLNDLARAADYDPTPRRGGRAKIALAAGLDPTHVGRILDGKIKPDIDTMRKLALVFHEKTGVTILDMLQHAGDLTAEEIPLPGAAVPDVGDLDLELVAERMNVPEGQRRLFASLVESVAEQLSDGQKRTTVSGHATQTGGKSSAEG